MKELKKEEKRKEGYRIIETDPKKNKIHREYRVICEECGKEILKFVVYYQNIYYDVNMVSLIDFTCPNCGARFEEIPLS